MSSASIRFDSVDLDVFGDASFDQNPLHVSEGYARKTPYGERVVFGVLAIIAALRVLPARGGWRLARLEADFLSPLFVGVEYRVELTTRSETEARVTVSDGLIELLTIRLLLEPGLANGDAVPVDAVRVRDVPADHDSASIAHASRIEGTYVPKATAAAELAARFGLTERGVGAAHLAALLWSSYLIGMELPGERALFSRLTLQVDNEAGSRGGALQYAANVEGFDERFNLVRIHGALRVGSALFATAEMSAFIRDDAPAPSAQAMRELLPPSRRLQDRIALVTGASRGFGARLSLALALQGCTVLVNFLRSAENAAALADELREGPGSIVPLRGDASDLVWSAATRERILAEYGGLDVLVCNAALPLRAISLEQQQAARLVEYVSKSFALATTPMAAFLDLVAARAGWNVVMSSSAVQDPPRDWPHYVSAKAAIEALARVSVMQHPGAGCLIVRPPRMLTDLTNDPAPFARQRALRPEVVAAQVARRLLEPPVPGVVEVLDSFS